MENTPTGLRGVAAICLQLLFFQKGFEIEMCKLVVQRLNLDPNIRILCFARATIRPCNYHCG
jgi:hypothetical protein